LTVQNQISQPSEIVAAAHAGGLMASQFPYYPMQGIGTALIPPQKQSDWIAIDPNGASEAALVGGLSPLVVTNGSVNFLRTRTTWTMNGLIPVTAYFDWQDLVTLNDFREDCFVIGQSPPFNNNPGGTKDSLAIANQFKDEVLAEAFIYETENAFQAVKSLAPQFEVAPSQTSRGRFDFLIPVNVLPGLFVIAGNIQGVTAFNFTL
jgi:phage tail sheath gpL-like